MRALRRRERLVDYAFGIGWVLTSRTPEPVGRRLLESAADRLWKQHGPTVVQLEANLWRAAPGLDQAGMRELSHRAMRSYFRYWHEAFMLPAWSNSRVVDTVVTSGEAELRAAYAAGRGAIIALPHMANWDLAGAWACLTGMPVTTVAERLKPASLFDRFVAYREHLGMEVIALTGDDNPMTRLRAAVHAERLICLIADRDLTGSGIAVTLLGKPAALPGGPAILARVTGSPLFAATLTFRGPLLHIHFSPQIPVVKGPGGVVEMTQAVADEFSAGIAAAPEDWHMLQKVFLDDVAAAGGMDPESAA